MNNQEQYFIVQLFTKADFSDPFLLNFRREKDNALTSKEYSTYLASNKIESENSRKLIDFFIEYDEGALIPEKCDAYEPIRDKFSKDDISGPLRWLSQPGGAIFFKKTKAIKYQGRIENHRFAPVWQEGKILKAKVEEPRFLGEIVLYIEARSLKRKPFDYLFNFLLQLARVVNAGYGLVALEEEYASNQVKISKINEDHRLPGIFWINYFGPDYASLFGDEKLNKVLPASKKFNHEGEFIFMLSEDAKYYLGDKKDYGIIALLGEENFR
jgi:hypothetical protein